MGFSEPVTEVQVPTAEPVPALSVQLFGGPLRSGLQIPLESLKLNLMVVVGLVDQMIRGLNWLGL